MAFISCQWYPYDYIEHFKWPAEGMVAPGELTCCSFIRNLKYTQGKVSVYKYCYITMQRLPF